MSVIKASPSNLSYGNIPLNKKEEEIMNLAYAVVDAKAKQLKAEKEAKELFALSKSQIEESKRLALDSKEMENKIIALKISEQKDLKLAEMKAESSRVKAESSKMKAASSEQKRKEADLAKKDLFVDMFYTTFYGNNNPPPANEIDSIYTTYLAHEEFAIVPGVTGKGVTQVNSTKIFADFLAKHKEITKCDFRQFKNRFVDITPLAEYLALPACSVKAIAISSNISDVSKASLTAAVNQRKEALKPLTVKYFDI